MYLKLPKIQNALKVTADSSDSVHSYVHVFNDTAIAIPKSKKSIICVNLKEYFKTEFQNDYIQYEKEFFDLLNFMNGKSFTVEFWKGFTEMKFITVLHGPVDVLQVEENGFSYEVQYEKNSNVDTDDFQSDLKEVFKYLNKQSSKDRYPAVSDGFIPGEFVSLIYKCFSSPLQNDNIIISQRGELNTYHFCFHRRYYIFGCFGVSEEEQSDLFSILESLEMCRGINGEIKAYDTEMLEDD